MAVPPRRPSLRRRLARLGALVALVVGLVPLGATAAHAAPGPPTSYPGHQYGSGASAATADKPQSKLWFHDGSWWALMVTPTGTVNVYELMANHTWRDTGTVVDERAASTGDALWTDGKLYVISRTGGSGGQVRLYRYSYAAGPRTFSRDSGYPVTPAGSGGTESATIDKDSLDRLWITFTRSSKVYVAHSTTSDTTWTAPFRITGADTDVAADDISALVAMPGKIGVMWSDQASKSFRFAVHLDSDPDTAWTVESPLSGTRLVDDHINLKSISGDDQGRVHAALKTSRGDSSSDPDSDPSLVVLSRSSTGTWTSATSATVGDGLTRPQLALDTTNGLLFVMQSTESGGKAYYKSAPLGNISFPPGKGDTLISAPGALINNVSTTKDPVTAATGLVAIASDQFARRYYHAEIALGTVAPSAPTASFTSQPSLDDPLTVQFSDTSAENPTSWAWDFGDGATSTDENPSHTYAAPGQYAVTLRATNAAGTSPPATQNVTVTAPAPVPTATFTTAPGPAGPLSVQFTDTSTGTPTSWAWDFGDGTTSTEQNPSHTYAAAGEFTVTLTATNAAGASPPATLVVAVEGAAGPTEAPTAEFAAAPTSGLAPLTVQFTDASTQNPTSWAWDFGDGTTSTEQNPSHTFAAGEYTVSLVATNAVGSSEPVTHEVDATAQGAAIAVAGSTTSTSLPATTSVVLTKPTGSAVGDVLLATFTADNRPTVATAPAGWTSFVPALRPAEASLFGYYHVVTAADAGTNSWTWTLSAAQKWNGGVTRFTGVDPVSPLDTTVSSATNLSSTATTVSVPSVTTATPGALLVGGLGANGTTPLTTPPTGWTLTWQSTGAQAASQAHRAQAAPGPTGAQVWTISEGRAVAAWVTALRPGGPAGPQAPVASFTDAPPSPSDPLTIQFSDTSTGAPTEWEWDFGDGGTSTQQNPSHTFAAPGSYTVSLVAGNGAGASPPVSRVVTVQVAPAGIAMAGSTTGVSVPATTSVTLTKPSGTAVGDLLVATFTVDNRPTVTAPAGWTSFVPQLRPAEASLFGYYRVVTAADAGATSWTWTTSSAQKWNGGVTRFTGVSPTTPLDTAVASSTNLSATATTITVPGVTTVTPGAMVIGGLGANGSTPQTTPPPGWTLTWQSTGAQIASQAHRAQPTPGASGNQLWTISEGRAVAAWIVALRPA
ncbi:PKD domain-containing protein [Pseudonocardia lacus]|uniref:PKD domain-containing protein n=1 Tax=Pseudonocardia lacus TaxID=2835865 RepID=UPI0020279783|nr:PKD domain-containing protein [Pseudonocardia lacus]